LALTLAACGGGDGTTATTQSTTSSTSPVLQMDALKGNEAADTLQMQIKSVKQSTSERVTPRAITLEPLMGAKAAAISAPTPGRPLQIGVARSVAVASNVAAMNALWSWTKLDDGRQVAAVSVQSPDAKALRLGLRVEQLPPGTQLRLYAPGSDQTVEIAGTEVTRALQRNIDAGATGDAAYTYWLPTVDGATAALEVTLAANMDPALLKVSLPQVSHAKVLPTEAAMELEASGSCNVNVMCSSGVSDQMHAVALMDFVDSGDEYVCTGSLLNNSAADKTPYFLSANHCISTQTVATTLETYWNYRTASCSGTSIDSTFSRVVGGATLLYASSDTDTSFLRLTGTPPSNAVFAGWDATNVAAVGNSVYTIHHPSGDVQKISKGNVASHQTCWSAGENIGCTDATSSTGTFYETSFTSGVTEGGSSGGPLYSSDGKVIGQLYGGSASCSYRSGSEVYGRFDVAYKAALSKWLGTTSSTTTGTLMPVYRFYNATTGAHFYTISSLERDYVIATYPVFQYEGPSFQAYSGAATGMSAVYRFYNTVSGAHFYTINAAERDFVIATYPVYSYEGPSWYAQTSSGNGTSPMFRFYNTKRGAHFYTISSAERDFVMASYPDFSYEGSVYYAWPLQ
jgi:hypothetical protein